MNLTLAFRRAVFVSASLLFACESDPDEGPPALSAECDDCLARDACALAWQACIDDSSCETHAVCMVREQCYTEPATSSCASDAGCELGSDASQESWQLSDDFETCARTECAEPCGFVEP